MSIKSRRRKQEFYKQVVVWFIAATMILSVFGVIFYGFSAPGGTVSYNGFKFMQAAPGSLGIPEWKLKTEQGTVMFDFLPDVVDDIRLEPGFVQILATTAQIDFTSPWQGNYSQGIAEAEFELEVALSVAFGKYLRKGFDAENPYGRQVITCGNATATVPVIYFYPDNASEQAIEGNCLRVGVASDVDALRVKDAILYLMLGVIE